MYGFPLIARFCPVFGIINTSYQKLPFGSGDYPDKLLFHQALNLVSNSSFLAPCTVSPRTAEAGPIEKVDCAVVGSGIR